MVILIDIVALVSLFKCQCTLVWELKELTSSSLSKQAQNSVSEPSFKTQDSASVPTKNT